MNYYFFIILRTISALGELVQLTRKLLKLTYLEGRNVTSILFFKCLKCFNFNTFVCPNYLLQ